jgi:hypothetical protein
LGEYKFRLSSGVRMLGMGSRVDRQFTFKISTFLVINEAAYVQT